jgi:hypothetical protein
MVYTSNFGGGLKQIPLHSLIQRGRGDDIFVVVDKENNSRYGVLSIERNLHEYNQALTLAAEQCDGEPIMVAVEDPESGSPMILARELCYKGERRFLAVIFNATFANNPEENRKGSFCLRLSGEMDADSKVSERIIYSPGEHIEWNAEQIDTIMTLLNA